jgi:signal transduction histidine kinase
MDENSCEKTKEKDYISNKELINNYRLSLTERIVRNLAHEIRNPLTNVMLGLEQLKNEYPPQHEDTQIFFNIISRNCARINDLITVLVDAAKPAELSLGMHSINDLLEDVLNISKAKMESKKITLNKQFAEGLPKISVDSEKIKVVFDNILENAFRAMDGFPGKLEVKTAFANNSLSISIKDNGIGILPDDLEKIFDPFFRFKSNGAGLGLTLAQNIIANHNGMIDVSSHPADGTVFTVILNP